MNAVQKIVKVSQKISTVQEFYEFSEGIHKMFECDQTDSDIKNYLEALREIIFNPYEDYDFPRNFFFKQSMKYPKDFNSMFKLKSEGQEGVRNLSNSIKKNA